MKQLAAFIALLMVSGTAGAAIGTPKISAQDMTVTSTKSEQTTTAKTQIPLVTDKEDLSSTQTAALGQLIKQMGDEQLPKWLTPEQKKELSGMEPGAAEKAILQWSEEYLKGKQRLTKQDEGVKRLLAQSRLNKDKNTTATKAHPIFTPKEQERFNKMTDKQRIDYLRKKGIHIRIEREKSGDALTTATLEDIATSSGETLNLEGKTASSKDGSTTMTVRVKKKKKQ